MFNITTKRWRCQFSSASRQRVSLEAFLGITKTTSRGSILEARHLHEVEVYVTHKVRGWSVGGLEAVEEHVVADAMRLAVERVVSKIVSLWEGAHLGGAQVMRATAAVEPTVRT